MLVFAQFVLSLARKQANPFINTYISGCKGDGVVNELARS
jgi:hypothetical protein